MLPGLSTFLIFHLFNKAIDSGNRALGSLPVGLYGSTKKRLRVPGRLEFVPILHLRQHLLPSELEAELFSVSLHPVDHGTVRVQLIVLFSVRPALKKLKEDLLQLVQLVIKLSPLTDQLYLLTGLNILDLRQDLPILIAVDMLISR